MHEASMRVDLNRVHPSWSVRALKEESPAVRCVVAACAPEHLRHAIRTGLELEGHDLAGERAADADVLSWALVLWTERLVGGDPARADDPPAIALITRLSPRRGYAICRLAGEIKCLLGDRQPAQGWPGPTWRARMTWIQESLARVDQSFLEQVSRDLAAKALGKVPRRHFAARLGVQTLGRLLADCEPFRVRWALQHLPYPIAKLIRSLIPSPASVQASLMQGESLILQTAWDRLKLEGRVECPRPD
jgi:hypothetical protein